MKLTLALVAALALASLIPVSRAAEDDVAGIELLRDPALSKGIAQGYANNLSKYERVNCQARWAGKGMGAGAVRPLRPPAVFGRR